ncbi:MAG: hypothetical protein FJY99_05460 [Candidatus Sericytochromatia bacterium]|nr:hypothetical protein [Candidatus Tanganyikabacteria bacterium]
MNRLAALGRVPGRWRQGLMAALAMAVVVVPCVIWLRRPEIPRNTLLKPVEAAMRPEIELQFEQVEVRGRDKGLARWDIQVPEMTAGQNQRVIQFVGKPKGRFVNLKDWKADPAATLPPAAVAVGPTPRPAPSPEVRTLRWAAREAEYDNDYEELTIRGAATFTTDDKDTLTTEEARYKVREHRMNLPRRLRLKSHDGKMLVQADKASADTQLEILELAGRVRIDSAGEIGR